LCPASRTPAKERQSRLPATVDEISEHAFQFGLPSEELGRIINVITLRNELDQSSVTTLIKNLYPAENVPSDAAIAVVGALGQGKTKPSACTQAGLVKWLSLVQEVLEDSTVLSQLYSVLFDLLDMISLR
jgi:centromere protein I